MPLKNPIIFTLLVLTVLLGVGIATYFFGLPLLQGAARCRFGGSTRAFGCSTSFGMTGVTVVAGFAIGAIWSKFGRQ